jgi:hypothetical protein
VRCVIGLKDHQLSGKAAATGRLTSTCSLLYSGTSPGPKLSPWPSDEECRDRHAWQLRPARDVPSNFARFYSRTYRTPHPMISIYSGEEPGCVVLCSRKTPQVQARRPPVPVLGCHTHDDQEQQHSCLIPQLVVWFSQLWMLLTPSDTTWLARPIAASRIAGHAWIKHLT